MTTSKHHSPTLDTEYLMEMHMSLDPPQKINDKFFIANIPGGWFKGAKLRGTIIPPAADWGHILPSGVFRIDVRLSLKTDDGEIIFTSYNGIISATPSIWDRLLAGATAGPDEVYFVAAPIFQTASDRYSWLNHIQAIARMVSFKVGDHLRYEVFAVKWRL